MKRFLLLFCAAVLVCSLMIVPAFAADSYSVVFDNCSFGSYGSFILPFGSYQVTLFNASNSAVFTSSPFDFEQTSAIYPLYDGDVLAYQLWIEHLPEEGATYFEMERVNDSYPIIYEEELCLLFSITLDSIDPVIPPAPEPVSPIAGIFGVFTGVGSWLAGQLGTTTSLFWNGQGLTFLGVLSVSGLALAVVLLLVMVVVRFLRFRG